MSDAATAIRCAAGPVVLVSGGSRGLGLAIVEDLLAHGVGWPTFARTVTPELSELVAKYDGAALAAAVDATDRAAVDAYVRGSRGSSVRVDGLVNNAAIGQDSLHVHTSPDTIANDHQRNLTAPLLLTRAVVRRILARGGRGRVVTITSICAQRGFPGLAAYAATKGGMEAATRALAREFRDRVLINCVAPGFFASEMSAVLGQTELDAIVRRTPTGRLAEPADVLPLVRMLLLGDTNIQGQSYDRRRRRDVLTRPPGRARFGRRPRPAESWWANRRGMAGSGRTSRMEGWCNGARRSMGIRTLSGGRSTRRSPDNGCRRCSPPAPGSANRTGSGRDGQQSRRPRSCSMYPSSCG